ncbi:MAG: hypothetical protein IJ348_05180 [Alistipes sp.]|nr:hypothetical protein [Alistipes sp.]
MKKILSLVVLFAATAMISCCGNNAKKAEASCCEGCKTECAACPSAEGCEAAAPAAEAPAEAPAQ